MNSLIKEPDWLRLARIGRLRILRSSYFWLIAVPLLAQWLSKVPRELVFNVLGTELTLTFDLPFSWKVFYFSAVSVAIATTIYGWYCPETIRLYDNFAHFLQESASQLSLKAELWGFLRRTNRDDMEHRLNLFGEMFCEPSSVEATGDIETGFLREFNIRPNRMSDAFDYVRAIVARAAPVACWACAFFYAVGLLLLFWVFAKTVWFVTWFTVSRI